MLRLKDFVYDLPKNLIAQKPVSPRDSSRLLILEKTTGKIVHKHFYDLSDYLRAGDILVLNDTKVIAARLIGRRQETGGKVEVFLLKKQTTVKNGGEIWQCLIGGQRRKENLRVEFSGGLTGEIVKNNLDGTWLVKFNKGGRAFNKLVEKIGRVPLPPYVKRAAALTADKTNYQTVYANAAKVGSVAAPTAGFHFTKALMAKLKKQGVQIKYVTLRVGLGTFAPVKTDKISQHKMHSEYAEIGKAVMADILKAKRDGRRVIAVGTTSVRVLESFKNKYSFWTDIFIYPGFKFKLVDGLITNFHLPKSTLLMLVSAFAQATVDKSAFARGAADESVMSGRDKIIKAYRAAIRKKYRFYSYGDAMLII